MATRFYLTNSGAAAVNPSFDPGWEQTGEADRVLMLPKARTVTLQALADSTTITVPITTTQDILCRQFVSDPLQAGVLIDAKVLFSLVVRAFESATTANVTLAVVAKAVSQDGGTLRGTLFSNFNQDTEWAVSASAATRIVAQTAVTSVTTQPGDRLVIEVGGHAAAPSAGGSYNMRFGNNAATDFALTTALTTDLNPWCEFSVDLFGTGMNDFQQASARDGNTGIISVSERAR